MRIALFILLMALVLPTLPGCTNVPLRSSAPVRPESTESDDSAESLFLKSFEELAQSDRSPALMTLRKVHPKSVWTEKAETLADLHRSRRQAERQTQKVKTDLRTCKDDELRHREQIDQLKNDLRRMKDLVIEMELRSQ